MKNQEDFLTKYKYYDKKNETPQVDDSEIGQTKS